GCPAVMKTAAFGYDGKGQIPIRSADQALAAWDSLDRQEAVLESFIDLQREISVIGARGVDGRRSHFAPIDNAHRHHILDVSTAPSTVAPALAAQAIAATEAVLDALDYVGILCIEFFVTRGDRLLINEL